jgi:hypothetical protein
MPAYSDLTLRLTYVSDLRHRKLGSIRGRLSRNWVWRGVAPNARRRGKSKNNLAGLGASARSGKQLLSK